MQEAAKLLKAGQHKQALELVNKVLAAKPRDAQARFLKGLIFTEQGKTKEAIEIFTKLTQDYPELPEPYNNLAVIYASQGQYDKARAALEQSIRTHPSYATAYENLGDVYAKLASQAYDKALQIDSSNTAAKNKLSLVRELVGGARRRRRSRGRDPRRQPSRQPRRQSRLRRSREAQAWPPQKPRREKPAADASRRGADSGKRLGAGMVQEGRRRLPRLLRQDFKTPGGEARADWEKTRRAAHQRRPSRSRSASASPKVTMTAPTGRRVTFRQDYRSDVLKSQQPQDAGAW